MFLPRIEIFKIKPESFDLYIRSDTLSNVINVMLNIRIFLLWHVCPCQISRLSRIRRQSVGQNPLKISRIYLSIRCLICSKHGRALCPPVITADDRWYILRAIIMSVIRPGYRLILSNIIHTYVCTCTRDIREVNIDNNIVIIFHVSKIFSYI